MDETKDLEEKKSVYKTKEKTVLKQKQKTPKKLGGRSAGPGPRRGGGDVADDRAESLPDPGHVARRHRPRPGRRAPPPGALPRKDRRRRFRNGTSLTTSPNLT